MVVDNKIIIKPNVLTLTLEILKIIKKTEFSTPKHKAFKRILASSHSTPSISHTKIMVMSSFTIIFYQQFQHNKL